VEALRRKRENVWDGPALVAVVKEGQESEDLLRSQDAASDRARLNKGYI